VAAILWLILLRLHFAPHWSKTSNILDSTTFTLPTTDCAAHLRDEHQLSETAKIGVVTVTYNSSRVIDGFMNSLLQQSYSNFVVYIVDNASSDQTLEQVRRYTDTRIIVIANTKNVGIAEANNQGILAGLTAGCASILFLNNDTEFGPSLLENMATGLKKFDCEMIAPKIVFHDNQQVIWSAGGGFSPLKGYAGFHYGLGEPDRGQFDESRRVEHAPACCLLVRKEVFERVGFMDSRYFVYLEDTDFCYRAKRAGVKLYYFPFALLLHKASSLTGGPESDFSVRYRTRNHVYFMLKHLGPWRGLFFLPAFQIHQLLKLVSRKIDLSGFFLRESAFIEGLRVWKHSIANEGQQS
jgi:GT2 family glycosyltransferase